MSRTKRCQSFRDGEREREGRGKDVVLSFSMSLFQFFSLQYANMHTHFSYPMEHHWWEVCFSSISLPACPSVPPSVKLPVNCQLSSGSIPFTDKTINPVSLFSNFYPNKFSFPSSSPSEYPSYVFDMHKNKYKKFCISDHHPWDKIIWRKFDQSLPRLRSKTLN